MSKQFQYKVSRPVERTRYNEVPEPSFEGELSNPFYGDYWSTFGSGSSIIRTRMEAHDRELGYALSFDGIDDRVIVPRVSGNGLNASTLSIVGRFYRSTWSTTRRMALLSKDSDTAGAAGWGLHINYSVGYLSAIAYIGGAFREAKYLLSNISAGWHTFGFTYEGRNLRLYVDGVNVATYTHGSNVAIGYGAGVEGAYDMGVGAQYRYLASGDPIDPSGNWFDGMIDSLMFWNTGSVLPSTEVITTAQMLDIHNTGIYFLTADHDGHYYTFDEESTDRAEDYEGGNPATIEGCTKVAGVEGRNVSLRITTSTSGASNQGITQDGDHHMPVDPSSEYVFSAWVKGTAGHQFILEYYEDDTTNYAFIFETFTGDWQRVSQRVTTEAGSTEGYLTFYVTDADDSAKVAYIDHIMFEKTDTLHDYFDKYTPNVGRNLYYYDYETERHVAVIQDWEYITSWDADISDPPEFTKELNTAGSDMVLHLARPVDDFGEDDDVAYNNKVDVYVIDDEAVNGQLLFSGYITSYIPVHGSQEQIKVKIQTFGFQFTDYMIETGEVAALEQADQSGAARGFNNTLSVYPYMGQGFIVPEDTYAISSISLLMYAESGYEDRLVKLAIYDTYAKAQAATYGGGSGDVPVASGYALADITTGWVRFELENELRVSPLQPFWFATTVEYPAGSSEPTTHKVLGSDSNPYADGYMFRRESGVNTEYLTTDLCFRINTPVGGTTSPFLSYDPSQMLREIIDNYQLQGGVVTYTDDSIQDTGTEVSYTFKSATVMEGVQKVLELAPEDWYWFVDPATSIIHLKHIDAATIHTFTLGKNIEGLEPNKRTEDMVNLIHFIGGDIGGGVNFYKVYRNEASIAEYGQRLLVFTDNRVTNESTADIMAETLMRPQPEVRIENFKIIDGAYDVESVQVGDLSLYKGFAGKGRALWNQVKWNQFRWNYDHRHMGTLKLQIAKINYHPDILTIHVSSTPLDVNKRIEDIKRNLDKQQTINNPDEPEVE